MCQLKMLGNFHILRVCLEITNGSNETTIGLYLLSSSVIVNTSCSDECLFQAAQMCFILN